MFRKIFRKTTLLALISLFLFLNLSPLAMACSLSDARNTYLKLFKKDSKIVEYSIPEELEKNIKESVKNIYGEQQVNVIYPRVLEIIKKAKQNRPLKLYMEDLSRTSDWYKDEIIYMFYVDQFGVSDKNSANTFEDTIKMLDYLEDLGVTTIFMLPFIDSPMGDAGFDIRDPKNVREDLGGMKEFREFIAEARKRGFKIKADLILNHFSDQHEWFQDALQGDEKKANYFVSRKKLPEYEKYRDEQVGIVVEYKEDEGKVSKRRLIFPDICENHYRKVNIKGEDYYFYHTFYPFQIDVNWQNPEVLYYMLDVLAHWANIGVDIFRMDAIPYYIKKEGTNAENLKETHEVIKLLSSFVQAIAPRSVMQAEACQWPEDILPYFGEQQSTNHEILCDNKKKIKRTDEVQIAYHFPYMPAIWASMLTGDNSHFWKAYAQTPEIPETATWTVFLRVHDELTLEMVDVETRKLIYGKLVEKGAEFRKGFGVSGRMANFLDNRPDKIALAFSILMSMPGIPLIYYGDEIGVQNNWRYAKTSEAQREVMAKAKGDELDVISFFDSRDINRGPVTKEAFYEAQQNKDSFGGTIYQRVKKLIHLRKENPVISRGEFKKLDTGQKEIFAYLRTYGSEQMIMINNLCGETTDSKITLPENISAKVNRTKTLEDIISGKIIELEQVASKRSSEKRDALVDILRQRSSNTYKIKLEPYQSVWIKLK